MYGVYVHKCAYVRVNIHINIYVKKKLEVHQYNDLPVGRPVGCHLIFTQTTLHMTHFRSDVATVPTLALV